MNNSSSNSDDFKDNLRILLQTYGLLIKQIRRLFILESKLAKKSLLLIFIYSAIAIVLLFSTWAVIVGLIIISVNLLLHNWLLTLGLTAFFNIILLWITVKSIIGFIHNLKFSHTRKHLFHWGENANASQAIAESDSTAG